MSGKDNRIIQGTELPDLEAAVNGSPEPQPSQSYTQPSQPGDFPNVDMKLLDDSVYHFLQKRGFVDYDLPLSGLKITHNLKVYNSINGETLEKIVRTLGNSFFKLVKPQYHPAFYEDEVKYFLTAEIQLNKQIPLDALKNAITALVGQENTDYFIQEFQDKLGITGEKIVDISKPEVARYLPGISQLKSLQGRSTILKDPFLLLLFLEPEERKYLIHFFNEAKLNNQSPHILQGVSVTSPMPVRDYAMSEHDIKRITTNPQILPFTEILRIGQKYKIKGITQYTDRLEKFNQQLRDIPTK